MQSANSTADHSPQHPVVCSWCRATLREGDPALPVSHSICKPCAAKVEAEMVARHESGQAVRT
jgi:hypothetical protein